MNRLLGMTVLMAGAGLLAISACGRDAREPEMQPAAGLAAAYSPKDAVNAIAAARCDREQRCNNIGANAEYQNNEHCMNVARADAAEELDDEDCRRGIKPEDLNECVSQLRERGCSTVGGAFDSLGSMMSCRSGELCMD